MRKRYCNLNKICLSCKRNFKTDDKRQKYCSMVCVYDKNSERNKIISKLRTGIKYSNEYKKKMSERCKGLNTWRKGQKMSDEAKIKISKFQKGKKYRLGVKDSLEVRNKKSEARKLDKNPNWQGGKSFEKYTLEWSDTLREAIRQRDGHICQNCGIKESSLMGRHKKLDVHHKNSNKKDCCLNNLVALCKSCHQKLHHHYGFKK